jgi:hypothetical protein
VRLARGDKLNIEFSGHGVVELVGERVKRTAGGTSDATKETRSS